LTTIGCSQARFSVRSLVDLKGLTPITTRANA